MIMLCLVSGDSLDHTVLLPQTVSNYLLTAEIQKSLLFLSSMSVFCLDVPSYCGTTFLN